MQFNPKNTSLLILGITAVVFSRTMFWLFNDPEGPNLLVVMGMAVIVYFLSLAIYRLFQHLSLVSFTNLKKLSLVIFIQILLTSIFYICLK